METFPSTGTENGKLPLSEEVRRVPRHGSPCFLVLRDDLK